MSGLAHTYLADMYGEYRYWAAWTPLTRISIGDCGPLEDDLLFRRRRSVAEFGVSPSALASEEAERDPVLRFTSQNAVDITAQAAGKSADIPGVPSGEVGAKITFLRANATVVAALGVSERRLTDQYLLEQELKPLVERGIVPPDYVVVTDLVTADSARVLISTGAGQSVTLRAGASAPVGGFDLAALGGKLSIAVENTVGHESDGTNGATPIFRLMGFDIGNQIRRFKRWLLREGGGVPRISVGSIKAVPAVGSTVTVQPIAAEPLAVAALGREPFVVEPKAMRPLAIEPILVDAGGVNAVVDMPSIGMRRGGPLGSYRGIILGSVEADPRVGGPLAVRLFEDSPLLIEPIDNHPFLAKPARGASLAMEPTDLGPLDVADVSSRWMVDEDPFRFGYVELDEEAAVAEAAAPEEAAAAEESHAT